MPATTPILFPSGEDANPLNRRLPAEVVTRRRKEVKKVEEKPTDEVKVDLKTALSLKPEARLKWLGKACKMAEDGKASTTELYSIISSRKFAAGMHIKIGRRMMEVVREHLGIFSDKQQRHLKSDEWVLSATFKEKNGAEADGDEQDMDAAAQDRRADSSERSGDERQAPTRRTFQERQEEKRPRRDGQASAEPEGWTEATVARGQGEHARREALLAEERARRRAREREDQDALMAGQSWATRTTGANNKERWLAVEAENAKRREQEQLEAKKKQLEEEADSSLMALERIGIGQTKAPEPVIKPREKEKEKEKERRERKERKERH
mmetsp:Transcript_101205/g.269077  ORF Transcript_101205/g.269077 Transcript_101205/m.269077 type:complete len:325 (-) Transcript_101205:77-1051(-)